MALPGEKIWRSETVVSFPEWAEVLAGAGWGEEQVAAYRQAILGFLHFCRGSRASASIALAKSYIEKRERQGGKRDEGLREALRWFVRQGRTAEDGGRTARLR